MAIAYSIPSVYECNSYIPTIASLFANLKFPKDNFQLS